MTKIEGTPIGWLVDLLYLFAHCATILAQFIDNWLKTQSKGADIFDKKKMRILDEYDNCISKARIWLKKADEAMEKFGLDEDTYEATGRHSKQYTNVIASANELIQGSMLILDRGHCEGGSARVFKRLRSLPENGIFPESYISCFKMKYEIVPEPGDWIESPVHGQGFLDFHTGNGNWQCVFDSGEKVILNEKQFKLL